MLQQVLIFIIFLCPIVFFHELGHFLFARLFGVRVEVFSIGFGKKLFTKKIGDTEYALSLIPLGGYVKMFGDDPFSEDKIAEEDKKYAFTQKGKWARFWIVFGGPLANFIMAFFIFYGLFQFGEKVPEVSFGVLRTESVYHQQGLRTGDVLRSINGKDFLNISDLSGLTGDIQSIGVERNGRLKKLDVSLNLKSFITDLFSAPSFLRLPVVVNTQSEKFLVMLKGKSELISLDLLSEREGQLNLEIFKTENKGSKEVPDFKPIGAAVGSIVTINSGRDSFFNTLASSGYYPIDMMIDSLVLGSPADKAGLKKNAILTGVNGEPLFHFERIRKTVQKLGESKKDQPISVEYILNGEAASLALTPNERTVGEKKIYTVGIYSAGTFQGSKYYNRPPMGIGESLVRGWDRTIDSIAKTFGGFFRLFSSDFSMKNIGGPIAIGKVAAHSFSISLSYFFSLMALISVNLGVINLFPIPVLDGGHIVFIIFELINRGPLSRRKLEIAQQVGFSLIFVLIFVALFNDIARMF